MKKATTLILSIFFCLGLYAQDLKTYSGNMQDAILDQGKATYTYYEKDGQIIRQGKFSYTWNDKDSKSPRGKAYSYSLTKTINGEFKDGLKHGKWTYVINFTDYPLGHSMLGVNGDIFSTGSINMTANYVNGEANGTWTYQESYKDRYMAPSYNTWNWSAYGSPESHSITVNFKNGDVVGKMSRKDSFTKITIDLNFDENGYIDGVGTIDEKGNKMTYTTKNGLLIKEVHSNMSTASSKVVVDNTNLISDQNAEYSKTKFSLLENKYGQIAQTLSYFKQNKYFNYNKPFGNEPLIGGDKIMSEGFGGAIMIKIEPCKQFENSYCGNYQSSYEQAKKYFGKEDLKAIEQYEKCIECLNAEWSGVCSEEKKKYLLEIENKISEIKKMIEEKQAIKNLISWNSRPELLNANSSEFVYLIRNAEMNKLSIRYLIEWIDRREDKIQKILDLKGDGLNTLFEYQNYNINRSLFEFSTDVDKIFFNKFFAADFQFLLEYAKVNKKYQEIFDKNLNFQQIQKETKEIKEKWINELKNLNNIYLEARARNLVENFEMQIKKKDKMSYGPSSTVILRKKYTNIFEVIDSEVSKAFGLDNNSKIKFLLELESLVDKLIALDLNIINKEVSKMKKSSNDEKYDFIKNK